MTKKSPSTEAAADALDGPGGGTGIHVLIVTPLKVMMQGGLLGIAWTVLSMEVPMKSALVLTVFGPAPAKISPVVVTLIGLENMPTLPIKALKLAMPVVVISGEISGKLLIELLLVKLTD